MISTVPPFPPDIMACVRSAATYYQVPQIILLSILKVEGGKPGQAVKNTNGTYDLGPAQINTSWIQRMENQYGVKNAGNLVLHNMCYNIHAGAWILKREILNTSIYHPDFWKKVANYHSHTPKYNNIYQRKVYFAMQKIMKTNWA